MNAIRKIGTAIKILFSEGPMALVKSIKWYLAENYGPYRPEESIIAYNALNAEEMKGWMIDVGAYDGSTLSPFALSGWQVFAFEPDSKNREKLVESFGDAQNVVIDARALSDQVSKSAILYRSDESTGVSGLSSFLPSHQIGEEIEVTTLENVFDEHGLAHQDINFLKIDTEGFDLHVLRGYPWRISAPDLILCEFEDGKTVPLGYTFQDLADFLVGHGYRLIVSEWHPIKRYGDTHKWRRFAAYPCQLEDPKGWGNIFAAKKDGLYESLLSLCNL